MKHIQQKTRCRVQIKGRGSGFVENSTGRESDEPMFLHVALVPFSISARNIAKPHSGPDPNEVKNAKDLCEDLLANVREQYQRFKENPPQHNYGGYGQRGDRYSYGGYGGYQQHSPATASPSGQGTPAQAGTSGSPTDYSAQYAQYYGSDPYAAYGGYQNYVAYYQYYQQMAQQQQQAQETSAPPPPPPSSEAPPPPPPGSGSPPPPPGGSGGYGAVSNPPSSGQEQDLDADYSDTGTSSSGTITPG